MSRITPFGRLAGVASALTAAVGAAVMLATPAGAAATPTDRLKQAGQTAQPSVVLVHYTASGYLNDNRDGKSYGPYQFGLWGTGFFVSSDGYLVTAAHVAGLTNDQVKDDFVETYLANDARAIGCEAAGNCHQLIDSHRHGYQVATTLSDLKSTVTVFTQDMNAASSDTVGMPAELKASSPWGQRDIAVLKVNGQNEPVLPLSDGSRVQAQDLISIIGYPAIADTGAQTSLVPTVTTGTVSARKQGSPELGLAPGVTIFQTDATVEHGNSGGPAVNEDGQVIGLVSFGSSSTTNFLINAGDIQDLVRQAGASNTLGQIDRLWRDGLAYMGQHRYVRAKAAFEQCAGLNKVQVGCADMARRATGLLSQDEESRYAPKPSFPVGLLAGALGGLVLLAVVAVVVVALTRRGGPKGPSAAPVVALAAPAGYPVAPATAPVPQAMPPTAAPLPQWQPPPPATGGPTMPPPANPVGFAPPPATPGTVPTPPGPAPQPAFCSFCGSRMEAGQATCASCGYARR